MACNQKARLTRGFSTHIGLLVVGGAAPVSKEAHDSKMWMVRRCLYLV